jgi:hypothetical protein
VLKDSAMKRGIKNEGVYRALLNNEQEELKSDSE